MKRLIFSFLIVGILVPTTEIVGQTRYRAAAQDDIREAVFRYQFLDNASSLKQNAKVYFLSMGQEKDPSNEFLERFNGHVPPIRRASRALTEPGVKDKVTDEDGIIFRVVRIRWISTREVIVTGGYYEGNMSSSGYVYRVRKKGKQWIVISDRMLYIS